MEIFAAVLAFFLAIFVEATIGYQWNMPGIGNTLAISLMGALILWAVRHPKKS